MRFQLWPDGGVDELSKKAIRRFNDQFEKALRHGDCGSGTGRNEQETRRI